MNNIIIELSAEDRARLDKLTEAIKGLTVAPCIEAEAVAPIQPTAQESTKQEAPASTTPEPAPAEPSAPATPVEKPAPEPKKAEAAPEVTAAELQSKVVKLVSAGKKAETRAIVMEYANSVSEIPAEKRAEVLERLTALEG